MFPLVIMDTSYNACHAGFIRTEAQLIDSTTYKSLNVINLSWLISQTNNIIQYFCSLTQHKFQTENAVVHQVETMETFEFILVQAVLDGLGVMLTRCSPTLNGFWQNQQEAVVNACVVSNSNG